MEIPSVDIDAFQDIFNSEKWANINLQNTTIVIVASLSATTDIEKTLNKSKNKHKRKHGGHKRREEEKNLL